MKKKLLIATLAAVVAACGLIAFKAEAQSAGLRRAPGAMMQRVKQHLGITDAQSVEIRTVLKDDGRILAELSRAIHDARVKLRDTIQSDKASEADVRAASVGLAKAQAEMAVERHKLFGKIKPILTEEQLQRMAQLQDRMDDFIDGAIDAIEQKLAE